MKKKTDANHFMGKSTGYRLIDGVYHIAPVYIERFDRISDQQVGIEKMVKAVAGLAGGHRENGQSRGWIRGGSVQRK